MHFTSFAAIIGTRKESESSDFHILSAKPTLNNWTQVCKALLKQTGVFFTHDITFDVRAKWGGEGVKYKILRSPSINCISGGGVLKFNLAKTHQHVRKLKNPLTSRSLYEEWRGIIKRLLKLLVIREWDYLQSSK